MNDDLDGWLIGEDRECFCVGSSKGSSDSSEAEKCLDRERDGRGNLQFQCELDRCRDETEKDE